MNLLGLYTCYFMSLQAKECFQIQLLIKIIIYHLISRDTIPKIFKPLLFTNHTKWQRSGGIASTRTYFQVKPPQNDNKYATV